MNKENLRDRLGPVDAPEDDGDPPADELAERLYIARYARLTDMVSPGTLAREAREALRAAEAFREEQRRLWIEAVAERVALLNQK